MVSLWDGTAGGQRDFGTNGEFSHKLSLQVNLGGGSAGDELSGC